ncbi:hypothetical protein F5148DRAFT_1283820 [Russula earlei]|uniref:Uncharacterized protein n=1 Tax=Russula earlei TaxID=71964 RepID=A0ACC0UAZ1_9AGAM|nr:hypothetical protein F5148DRAFT_1283820 [Russula earlei]
MSQLSWSPPLKTRHHDAPHRSPLPLPYITSLHPCPINHRHIFQTILQVPRLHLGLQPNPVGCATLATTRSHERFQGHVQEEHQLILQAVHCSNLLIAQPEYILCDDVGIVGIFKYVDDQKMAPEHVVAFLAKNTDGILKDKVHNLQNKLVELPCSRRIPSQHAPDAGLVFDTLHKRETFVSHPARLFSMMFLFAALVIHKSVLCTSHADMNINETSSYVDLAPLYGNNKETLDNVGVAATAR